MILGVSRDSLKSHDKFIDKLGIPFLLLSDEEGKASSDYDVLKNKSMFGKTALGVIRSTFIIDGDGMLRKIYRNPKTETHAEEVLAALRALKAT